MQLKIRLWLMLKKMNCKIKLKNCSHAVKFVKKLKKKGKESEESEESEEFEESEEYKDFMIIRVKKIRF